MAYRPEIDGLRAVAVLAVLLFHACGLPSGGFTGVDVFFVISGYVITRVLTRDLASDRFTIMAFYERRARRIAPALVATLVATTAAAAFILLPSDFEVLGRSVLAATLMVSNVLFWNEAGYFDAAAVSKPLLHTWSLSIEEQFYLVYPLALAALWRRSPRAVAPVIAATLLLSFAASVVAVAKEPSAAFYLPPFRAWELLLGALAALRPLPRLGDRSALLGLGLIAAGYILLHEKTVFPGFAALAPTIGAALVLNGAQGGALSARLLAARPLVFIGKISYSLYLVHWPLIVLLEYRQGAALSPWQAALVVALTVALAAASWAIIEQPFRRPRSFGLYRRVFGATAAAAVGLCAVGGAIEVAQGFPDRLPANVRAAYGARSDTWTEGLKCWSDTKGRRGPSPDDVRAGRICRFGPARPDGALDFVVWGDSHAAAMTPAILDAAARRGATGALIAAGNCPPVLGFQPVGIREAVTRRCHALNAAASDLMREHPPKLVFMVARWPRYAMGSEYGDEGLLFDPRQVRPEVPGEDDKLSAALNAELDSLRASGVRPVLVLGTPEPGYNVPYATARALLAGETPDIAPPRAAVEARERDARAILADAALRHGATVIDPTPRFCDATRCWVEADGALLFSDHSHISLTAARRLSGLYDEAFRTIGGTAVAR